MNTKQLGAIGVAYASAHFASEGYAVFVPLSDVMRYDLVVDNGNGPQRVEVKTTASARDQFDIRTRNSGGEKVRTIDSAQVDLVFCYNVTTGSSKVFDSSELHGRKFVTI